MEGYTLANIFRLLIQKHFRVDGKYFLRFLYGLAMSLVLRPLRILEHPLTAGKIKTTKLQHDPVFVIGYYRSGTTYMITLFSKDPNRGYVSNIEAYLPTIFLGFPRIARWIIDLSIPDNRPMDNVGIPPEEPTEEEYAIGAYEKYSIYHGFVWPRNFKLYSKYNSFDGMPKDLERWKKRYNWFTQKMTASYKGKQIVYKNPTVTYQIKHILEMYPNAKFVHIYRNPYEVFSSNLRYHDEVIGIYTSLGLEGFEEARPFMEDHVHSQRTYKPNTHVMGKDVVARFNSCWGDIVDRHGYEQMSETEAPDESMVITLEMEDVGV